ncbi:MAG: hypothetical protein ACI4OJ_01835 [Lachnospiraceae bacterium]
MRDLQHLRALLPSHFPDRRIELNGEMLSPSCGALLLPRRGGGTLRLPADNIRSVVSCGHYTEFSCLSGPLRVRIPFHRVEEHLKKGPFLLVNRGILLNMDRILRPEGNGFRMEDGTWYGGRVRGFSSTLRTYEDYLLGEAAKRRYPGA